MEDKEILDLYWRHSDLAISETQSKYGSYCHTIAFNICGSREDAEECVNDVWLQAWSRIPPERPAYLPAFLGCIARSVAINRLKAKNRLKRGGGEAPLALDELTECLSGGVRPDRALEQKELERAVGRFVAGLPEEERRIFVLRYWYLSPIPVISAKLRCRPGRIKSILFRTRKKLKSFLEEEGLC